MATKSVFGDMLNQKVPSARKAPDATIKVKKPPGTGEFAFLGGNSLFRHPMENRGSDVSNGVWARMIGMKKPRGVNNG